VTKNFLQLVLTEFQSRRRAFHEQRHFFERSSALFEGAIRPTNRRFVSEMLIELSID